MKEPTIENFLAFEKEYKCNDIRVENIPIWSLYRYEIHNTIKKKVNNANSANDANEKLDKKDLLKMAVNAMKPIPNKPVDVLFVCDARRTKNPDNGFYENIFFDEISKRYNSLILEHPENRKHSVPNGMDNVFFTDRVAFKTNIAVKLSAKLKTKKRKRYRASIIASLTNVFNGMKDTFGVDIMDSIVEDMVDRMYYYEITKQYFSKILDKTKPKLIMELCYYMIDNFALSSLGKERGIPTAEYAHGFAFPTHTPMQFNAEENIEVLPDYHLMYSESQGSIVHFPKNVELLPMGFPFFEREREKYKTRFPRNKKTICFISTLAEGAQISKIASEVADRIGDEYHIIYKLHPKEYGYYKTRYPWLNNDKLEVIDNNDNHMFRYLAESNVIVSTRTASVEEGIGFGCKVVLLDYGDTRINMAYYIENGIPLVESANEVIDLIKNDKAGMLDENGIYKPDAMNNICNFIDKKIGD